MPRKAPPIKLTTTQGEVFTIQQLGLAELMAIREKFATADGNGNLTPEEGEVSSEQMFSMMEAAITAGPEEITEEYLNDLDLETQVELMKAVTDSMPLEMLSSLQEKFPKK